MSFIPHTDADKQEMLKKIGVSTVEELFKIIPEEVRLKSELKLPAKLSEYEVVKLIDSFAKANKSAGDNVCFMGGGAYDHFIPSIVGSIIDRPEFKTAYTPYQAEISQGTLQVMYEYQSMICALTGMDVANASLYDCGTALAESCFLANAHNRKTQMIYAGSVNPNYRLVAGSECAGREFTFDSAIAEDGTCDLKKLAEIVSNKTSAVIVQHPNSYGNFEQVAEIEKIAHQAGALFVSIIDPISLGILEAPGSYNADIVIAEGQSLGIPLSFGGPYLGVFAVKQDLVRKIPGRICGITEDTDGKRGFVLTLQTREQQIKREKATSNICSNQGLYMVAATVYMATMGKQGIKETAELCLSKSHYLAKEIKKLKGFELLNDKPFFKEFLVKTPVPAKDIIDVAIKDGVLAGIDTSRFADCKQGLLIAVTEKRTKEEMDKLVSILKKYAK
jgi:glycine dehydrogenase subunit 1